jgi:prepilin-type N-terminal cleavage/methylation domain-containing protein/prepilin-type processing-associated H-X9-DG protein
VCRGFTLVELLVVVSIIALLISILVPNLGRAKELTRRTYCQTNLHGLGRAWVMYWSDYGAMRTPQQFNPNAGVLDIISQYNFLVWAGQDATTGPPNYVNAGVLYKKKAVGNGNMYYCPTVQANRGWPWFGNSGGGFIGPGSPNAWPVVNATKTRMSYSTRRMLTYSDQSIAGLTDGNDPLLKATMILLAGMDGVKTAGSFSFMADNFTSMTLALYSHVPGVNVQYLDGHVSYWKDPTWDGATGTILYNNGITGFDVAFNWQHDNIWMQIDGAR